MKKLVYVVTWEQLHPNNATQVIAIREKKSKELNKAFPIKFENDGDVLMVNMELLNHIQHLVNDFDATIEWDMTHPEMVYL